MSSSAPAVSAADTSSPLDEVSSFVDGGAGSIALLLYLLRVLGAICLLIGTCVAGWWIAWQLVFNDIPFFQEIWGAGGGGGRPAQAAAQRAKAAGSSSGVGPSSSQPQRSAASQASFTAVSASSPASSAPASAISSSSSGSTSPAFHRMTSSPRSGQKSSRTVAFSDAPAREQPPQSSSPEGAVRQRQPQPRPGSAAATPPDKRW